MGTSLRLLLPAALLLSATLAQAADVTGPASVVSAGTIEIGDTRIRLRGLQAPSLDLVCIKDELEWDCGRAAATYLQAVIGEQPVHCQGQAPGDGGEVVATCHAGPDDLALKLVLAGFAFALRDHGDEYTEIEGVARRQRRGLWSSDFRLPWTVRVTDGP